MSTSSLNNNPDNPNVEAYLEALIQECEMKAPLKMAVVDYLGFTYQDDDGRFKQVGNTTAMNKRYGIRSKAHVEIYKFPIIHANYQPPQYD